MRITQYVVLLLIMSSCANQETESPFLSIPSSQSNINFNNKVIDRPEFNILDYLYFYNGGGVATGDLNNDGLPDIFFTSNLGEDKLYFNRGDFTFEDVSDRFNKEELKGWSTGVTMADVNQDGWLDIYVCKLGSYGPFKNHNKLFINKEGKRFVESAKEYGLDFSGFATQSAFFDYDQDGDLDCYLLNHSVKNPEQFRPSEIRERKDSLAGDVLLEYKDGFFTDVTESAGIYNSTIGFGLGIDIADVNNDGWLDIYIGNDFHENDYLYINQQDKTFKEVIAQTTGHTSNFSMGCAIADLNNDLKVDILTLDMKPFDEKVYKKSGGWESIEIYNFKRGFGYHHQSARNALQMNVGVSEALPMFSEQAAYYGLEATDWSWSPLLFDFDNDGDKDVFITNGIVRRPNDMDFVSFHFDPKDPNKVNQLQKMPEGNVPNCYFENDSKAKSFVKKEYFNNSISTGAAAADFNQDGLLDIVINNINAPATILKNNRDQKQNYYLSVKLRGEEENYFGIGASVYLYQDGKGQLSHIKTSSGFQSFSEPMSHFGLTNAKVDSIKVIWPDGFVQVETISEINTTLELKKRKTKKPQDANLNKVRFVNNVESYKHKKNDFNDQQTHKWLLYNLSDSGPRMTTVNESEIYLTGNKSTVSGKMNLTSMDFTFSTNKQIPNHAVSAFFDWDKDGDEDVFIGLNAKPESYGTADSSYLLLNENNSFTKMNLPLAEMIYDAEWSDLDENGFADLVVVGHWMPITIFYNDGKNLNKTELPESSGLWFSVLIDDLNGDNQKDIIAGNYGINHGLKASKENPIRFYQNDFDKNGYTETLVTYVKDGVEVPYPNQSLFASQIPAVKKKYLKNIDYASAKVNELVTEKMLNKGKRSQIVTLSSSCFLQEQKNTWKKQSLPSGLQMAPLFAIEKMKDNTYFFGGNFHEVDPNWGRQDATYLSAYNYGKEEWLNVSNSLRLPLVKGAIRDLIYKNEKLFIAMNNDYLKMIDFTN